jgi:hypothetical protein
MMSSTAPRVEDGMKLQITPSSLVTLMSGLSVPGTFIGAISRHYQVCGTGFRSQAAAGWDYWCLIPIRIVISCHIDAKEHTKSTAGSNQMDPFHYIHLSDAKVDIRGSHIGLFVRRDLGSDGKTSVIVVNFTDQRWKNVVEEPLARIKATLKRKLDGQAMIDPISVYLVYLSIALRWWNNVLLCFNKQLIMHVSYFLLFFIFSFAVEPLLYFFFFFFFGFTACSTFLLIDVFYLFIYIFFYNT